jgi:hypothetical protein
MKKGIMSISALMLFLMIGPVFALELPPEPMAFYGSITYNGAPISNGYYLVAKIGTTISGECEIVNGKYGTDYLNDIYSCIIIKPENSPSKIEFFLGDIKLGERTFVNHEIVYLNFSTTSLPTNFIPLSDGVCNLVECSYNLIDCDASKTNVCSGNGVCDKAVGETCAFNSQDCGACPTCGDGSCNNGETCSLCSTDCGACPTTTPPVSGGGGGGGGSSSHKKAPVINLSNSSTNNQTAIPNNSLVLTNTSTTESENEETTSGKGITGRAIEGISTFAKSKVGIGLIIFIVLFILFVILTSDKKLREENKRRKKIEKENGRIKIVKQSEKIKEEKVNTEKPKIEKKAEVIKPKTEKVKVEKSKIAEKRTEVIKPKTEPLKETKPAEEKKPEENKTQ